MLSPEIQARLNHARYNENDYQPNAAIAEAIGNKAIVMVVAPAAVGKTTVMDQVVHLSPDFGRVPVFSTRDARPDDEPGMFRLSPHDDTHVSQLLDKIERRDVVQYAVHPTQGTIYGTEAGDYPAKYNLLATLSSVVKGMRALPFEQTFTIGLITDPDHWQQWFNERFPDAHKDRRKRLNEAEQSLEWLLGDDQTLWLYNQPGASEQTAQTLIHIVEREDQPKDLRHEAEQLLAATKTLLV